MQTYPITHTYSNNSDSTNFHKMRTSLFFLLFSLIFMLMKDTSTGKLFCESHIHKNNSQKLDENFPILKKCLTIFF